MKSKILVLLSIISIFFISNSCRKDYLIGVTGSLSGIVQDAVTDANIRGAIVRVYVSGDSIHHMDSTNASGFYSINGIPLGTYIVTIVKAGYAPVITNITITPEYNNNGTANTTSSSKQSYTVGIVHNQTISPLNGFAQGLVLYQGSPAAGATVKVYTGFPNLIYTTTTNSYGEYSFSGLPVLSTVTFVSYNSSASASLSNKIPITSPVQPAVNANIVLTDNPLTLISYSGQGGTFVDTASQHIVLVFSENVSQAITNMLGGSIVLMSGVNTVGATLTYSNDSVIIAPANTLNPATKYTILYNVYATLSKNLSSNVSFTTDNTLGTITGAPAVTLTQITGTYYLQITTPPTSTYPISYTVYAKEPGNNNYISYISLASSSFSGNGWTIPLAIPVGTTFYVVPYITNNGVVTYGTPSNITSPL